MEMKYDSTQDTIRHIKNINMVMSKLLEDLEHRKVNHDHSKLESPEREGYNEFIPKLKTAKYGSAEYNNIRKEMMDTCLGHHYEVNRHHPEHFARGIKDFTIVDLVEYFSDTFAASMLSDTPYEKGLMVNADKHHLPPELVEIFKNTVNEYFPK